MLAEVAVKPRPLYLSVQTKFVLAVVLALLWVALSTVLAWPWILDLSRIVTPVGAWAIVFLIALLPGFMNAFLVTSLIVDRRPVRAIPRVYPGVSVLIAAFNEEACIADTIESILRCKYRGPLEILVIDDGSSDRTVERAGAVADERLRVIAAEHGGKAHALNVGLAACEHEIVITLDADTFLYADAIERLVQRLMTDPPNTAAVAGAVLVRNSRDGFIARMQEWDYFHGIASVKRAQSLFQGTLVAQGAFSIYRKSALQLVGGWPDKVGEDIVLTWAMLERGFRIGYAEDAVVFTNVPTTYGAFFKQRRRWSRGMIEAFRSYPSLLIKPRATTLFIYWNMFFPILDITFVCVFVPGIIAAFLGHFDIAGPPTLAVLPLALIVNFVMFRRQIPMFSAQGLRVRRNYFGFLAYLLVYNLVLQPATLAGYLSELIGLRKTWGTK